MSERENVAKWLWDTYGPTNPPWEKSHETGRDIYLGRATKLLALLAPPEAPEPVGWILESRTPSDRPDNKPGEWERADVAWDKEWRDQWLADPRGDELRAVPLYLATPSGEMERDHRAMADKVGEILKEALRCERGSPYRYDEGNGRFYVRWAAVEKDIRSAILASGEGDG